MEDVIANRRFPDISHVGPMCDEICIGKKLFRIVPPDTIHVPYDSHNVLEESLSNYFSAEAVLKPDGVRSEGAVRFRIAHKTEDQVSGRVDEFARSRMNPLGPSLTKEKVDDLVWILLRVSLGYFEPETTASECLVVILFG